MGGNRIINHPTPLLGVATTKGAKTLVDYSEKLYLQYFEGPPLIIFNEFFIHLVELWLFIHEVEIPWIWCHFIMLEESFYIQKTLVD